MFYLGNLVGDTFPVAVKKIAKIHDNIDLIGTIGYCKGRLGNFNLKKSL